MDGMTVEECLKMTSYPDSFSLSMDEEENGICSSPNQEISEIFFDVVDGEVVLYQVTEDQILDGNESNPEVVLMALDDEEEVDDQIPNRNPNKPEHKISYVDPQDYTHRITYRNGWVEQRHITLFNKIHGSQEVENTPNLQSTSTYYYDKIDGMKGNKVNVQPSTETDEDPQFLLDEDQPELCKIPHKNCKHKSDERLNIKNPLNRISAGKSQDTELNEAIHGIWQPNSESFVDEGNRKEIYNEIDLNGCVDANEGINNENKMYQGRSGKGAYEVDGVADKVEIHQTSGLENDYVTNSTETNQKEADENLQPTIEVIIKQKKGKEKVYKILKQDPWIVAYITNEIPSNIMGSESPHVSLSKTDGKEINKKAVDKNENLTKKFYITGKDGNFLYEVKEKKDVMRGMEKNEMDTSREHVQTTEISLSKIYCVKLNKKTFTEIKKRTKEFIVAQRNGEEKLYDILDSKNKAQPVKTKRNKIKTGKHKKKTKKLKKKTKKHKTKKHEKKISRKLEHQTGKPSLVEINGKGVGENITPIPHNSLSKKNGMEIKEKNKCEENQKFKEVSLSKKQNKKNGHKPNKKEKNKRKNRKEIRRKCRCGKLLPSIAEKRGIDNLADYFIEEQIFNICFDFHRAVKFDNLCAPQSVPKAVPDYGNKKCTYCGSLKCKIQIGKDKALMTHMAKFTRANPRRQPIKSYVENKPGQLQPEEPKKIILKPHEPTGPPIIKKNPTLKKALREVNNGLLTKVKSAVNNKPKGEKELAGKKPSKKIEDTVKKKSTKFAREELLENYEGNVEKDVEKSKKPMPKGKQKKEASNRFLVKKGKVKKDGVIDGPEMGYEEYQRLLKEQDEKAKDKIKDLKIKLNQDLISFRRLLNEKRKKGDIEKSKTKTIQNGIRRKSDVRRKKKNKEITKTLLENNDKGEQKKESLRNKTRKRKRKGTMVEEEVFLHKSKKRKGKVTSTSK